MPEGSLTSIRISPAGSCDSSSAAPPRKIDANRHSPLPSPRPSKSILRYSTSGLAVQRIFGIIFGVAALAKRQKKTLNGIVFPGILGVGALPLYLRSIAAGQAKGENRRYSMSSRSAGSASAMALGQISVIDRGKARDPQDEVTVLFDRFRDPLLRYLSGFGLTIADGEEVIQEVFLSLFQNLQRGRWNENPAGWLFRVAHNLGLKRRYRTGRDIERALGEGPEDLARDPGPSPEDQLIASRAQRRVLAVMRALSEQDRRCLSLRAEGLRYREIAQVLDMSLGAVSSSLARSLARIARSAER